MHRIALAGGELSSHQRHLETFVTPVTLRSVQVILASTTSLFPRHRFDQQ